jgi:FkbM family methyltransferase
MIDYNYVDNLKDAYFLVIGAMDGISHDNLAPHIRKNKFKGIFVEPVNEMFNKLQKNYEGFDGIEFANFAITESTGDAIIYRIDFDKKGQLYPDWSDGGSSLMPSKTAMASVKNLIEEKIKTITLNDLLEIHKPEKIDIVQIDAEGYDLPILKQFDFNKYQPKFFSIEILSMNNEEIQEIHDLFTKNGYQTRNNGSEILATKD